MSTLKLDVRKKAEDVYLPAWVMREIRTYLLDKCSGILELHCHDGIIRRVKATKVVVARE